MSTPPLRSMKLSGDGSPSLATFGDLPNELLRMIRAEVRFQRDCLPPPPMLTSLSQLHTKHALGKLRLVSRACNEMAKDLVAECVVLTRGNVEKINAMLSGPSVFDKSCRTLVLECGRYFSDHRVWGMLAGLVAKMQGVHTIQ